MKWISKKATERMSNGFGNSTQNNDDRNSYGENDQTRSAGKPHSKMSIKEMMKKRFGQKKSSQYVDYEEIK